MTTVLPPGIYVPIPTFFHEEPSDEQPIDVDTITRHVKYLCSAGVHGIVSLGSTGEAVHLSVEERELILRTTRKAIDDSSPNAKLLAGCSHESVRGTLSLIEQAAKAGAEYALVLPPSYFLTWIINRADAIYSFYTKVADKSPIPIIIYNCPGVTQHMDTPEGIIVKLAAHPNIAGIKCTDGNVGKASYICAHTDRKTFTVMSGAADCFFPFLTIGAQGCVPGFGNIVPRLLVQMFNLYTKHSAEDLQEIQRLQNQMIGPDHAVSQWDGIPGVKAVMQSVLGYGGLPRAPLLPSPQDDLPKIIQAIQPALKIERQLESNS
jgi:dihydrodipicolinate synthase/N-acetylneuraminate lyase